MTKAATLAGAVALVSMIRDPGQFSPPHTADVHPSEVENFKAQGWVEGSPEDLPQAGDPTSTAAEAAGQMANQIGELAEVLLGEFGGPTESESACEMAVRVLREQRETLTSFTSQESALATHLPEDGPEDATVMEKAGLLIVGHTDTIEKLKAELAKFDADGDGEPGGSKKAKPETAADAG